MKNLSFQVFFTGLIIEKQKKKEPIEQWIEPININPAERRTVNPIYSLFMIVTHAYL